MTQKNEDFFACQKAPKEFTNWKCLRVARQFWARSFITVVVAVVVSVANSIGGHAPANVRQFMWRN